MHSKISYFFISAIVILTVTSCKSSYVPNAANTPLLSEKGDFKVAINGGTSGVDPQLSYAVTNHLGVIANGSFKKENSNGNKHSFAELGLGYFTKLGENFRFETFGGIGKGDYTFLDDNGPEDLTLNNVELTRYFVQPTIGITTDVFDGSFTPRFVLANIADSSGKDNGLFVEPVVTGKVGYKYIKAIVQLGLSIPLDNSNANFNHQPLLLSLGLQFNISEMFKK